MAQTTSPRALITGGAVRIGREVALALADAGWGVAIHYHRSEKEARALAASIHKKGGHAVAIKANLADEKAVSKLMPQAVKLLGGPVTCLVNNASVFGKDSLETLSSSSWQRHMGVNFHAPLLLAKEMARQNIKNGIIINLLDGIWGWSMSPHFLSYSLSKLGLWNATELLARELAPHIRVNGVALGPTLIGKQDKEETFTKLAARAPLKRTSSPKEVCDTVLYLLNAPSVTGQVIQLGGGMHLRGDI